MGGYGVGSDGGAQRERRSEGSGRHGGACRRLSDRDGYAKRTDQVTALFDARMGSTAGVCAIDLR